MKNIYLCCMYLMLLMGGITAISTGFAQTQSCGPGETLHIIESGQNLFRIALGYGVSMDSIAQRNNISDVTSIFAGDSLCIPGTNGNAPSTISTSNNTTTTAINNSGGDYNFCNDPAFWGDGRCDSPDSNLKDCYWKMGWYLPRAASGEFGMSDIQSPCLYVVAGDNTTITIEKKTNSAGCIYFVVVLDGSPFIGSADLNIAGDHYDGSLQPLGNCQGLAIHGNDNSNILMGGDGNDAIYGYGSPDLIGGGDGDDIIYGGDESCSGTACNVLGVQGDIIVGGDGNDTIYGGDESCSGTLCNTVGTIGDVIVAGDGDDTIYGGDESCSGYKCNSAGHIGDVIIGGDGTDTVDGGTESDNGSGGGLVGDFCTESENETNCP